MDSFYRGLREADVVGLWKRRVFLCGSSARETWREGSFTGNSETYVDMSRKVLETERLSP